MKKSLFKNVLFAGVLSLAVFGGAAVVSAQNPKAQMEKRLADIVELKAKGLVGEDASGYVQFVGGAKEKEEVVKAENADRKRVYEAIAKKEGTTADVVGKRRALKNLENAKSGEFIQKDGKWVKK